MSHSESASLAARDELRALAKPTADATIAHHSKSFSLAAKLLPRDGRDDAAVVYSYCRHVDDAVDEVEPAAARAAIAVLRAELDEVYGAAAAPGGAAAGGHARLTAAVLGRFAAICADRRVPRQYPAALIDGVEMDALGASYRSIDDLVGYCYRVASVVGLMMCHVMKLAEPRALGYAAHLGIAMQLTNVCRDIAEDWRRGRLYVPDELLARHGAKELRAQLGATSEPPREARAALAAATRDLLALAERYYASAERGLAALPWRSAFAVRAARLIYAAIGDVIAAAGHDPMAPRAIVPRWRKLVLVAKAALGALGELPGRLLAPRRFAIPSSTLELDDVDRL